MMSILAGGTLMADFYIKIFMDDDKQKRLEEAGLADQITDIDGKKGIQVGMGKKEQKKLLKGFPEIEFDASNACVLPEAAEKTLMDIIVTSKTTDVMKAAISKLYNPLAGKELRSKVH
jgi:hypothetical protein